MDQYQTHAATVCCVLSGRRGEGRKMEVRIGTREEERRSNKKKINKK